MSIPQLFRGPPMKIRFVIAAAVIAAAAACSTTPTTVDAPRDGDGAPVLRDVTPPPPPDTTLTRGGGTLGSGS